MKTSIRRAGRALAPAALAAATLLSMASAAHAQKEMMGMFYSMQAAPKACGWKDAAPSTKLDASISAQEKALGITAAERKAMVSAAEADLAKSADCKGGLLRAMYDEAVK